MNKEYNVQELFDEILGRHLERLIGTRYGIGALPLNSIIIAFLIMLMERENEPDSLPDSSAERYTLEILSSELEEMGFDLGPDMNLTVQEMIQKGYIQVDQDRLIPQKAAISTSRLLDKVFPRMPGMSLVAYFFQTINEVKSTRKDLNAAVSQFDQTLRLHGVSLRKTPAAPARKEESSPAGEKTAPRRTLDTSSQEQRPSVWQSQLKSASTSDHPQVKLRGTDAGVFSSEPKILSSDNYAGKIEIKRVDFGTLVPSKDKPADSASDLEPAASGLQDPPPDLDSAPQQADICASDEPEKSEILSDFNLKALEPSEEKAETNVILEEKILDTADDDIEQQITAFAEHLALECPMCRQSKVQDEKTAKGKSYYKCTNQNCNFISWGRPHHILCPQCNNPFLIESDKAGKLILKCPRATCRFWQKPPWDAEDNLLDTMNSASPNSPPMPVISQKPRKKVVKRRVVRRKK